MEKTFLVGNYNRAATKVNLMAQKNMLGDKKPITNLINYTTILSVTLVNTYSLTKHLDDILFDKHLHR